VRLVGYLKRKLEQGLGKGAVFIYIHPHTHTCICLRMWVYVTDCKHNTPNK